MSKIAERIAKLSPNRQDLLSRLLKKGQIDLSHAVIMPRVRHSNHAPLSFAQQRLWLFLQLDPDNVSYNVPEALLLEGPLHVTVLAQSLSEIVRRHERRLIPSTSLSRRARRSKRHSRKYGEKFWESLGLEYTTTSLSWVVTPYSRPGHIAD